MRLVYLPIRDNFPANSRKFPIRIKILYLNFRSAERNVLIKSTAKSNLLWFRETLSSTYRIFQAAGVYSRKHF